MIIILLSHCMGNKRWLKFQRQSFLQTFIWLFWLWNNRATDFTFRTFLMESCIYFFIFCWQVLLWSLAQQLYSFSTRYPFLIFFFWHLFKLFQVIISITAMAVNQSRMPGVVSGYLNFRRFWTSNSTGLFSTCKPAGKRSWIRSSISRKFWTCQITYGNRVVIWIPTI